MAYFHEAIRHLNKKNSWTINLVSSVTYVSKVSSQNMEVKERGERREGRACRQ